MPSIYDGPPGESLFHTPYESLSSTSEWNATIPPLLQKALSEGDRSCALLGALLVEERLDILLTLWIPGFPSLAKDRDFTFSMKLRLLKACRIVPNKLRQAADSIRDIRNDFAHNLRLDSFEKLEARRGSSIRAACRAFPLPESLRVSEGGPVTRDLFHQVLQLTVGGLHAFEHNLLFMRSVVSEPKFTENMRAQNEALFWKSIEQLHSSESSGDGEAG